MADAASDPPCLLATERVHPGPDTTQDGTIEIDWPKALWLGLHAAFGLAGVLIWPEPAAAAVFVGLTAVTICAGHSVGMHRLLIHHAFACPRWLEHLLVWLGTLVGMAGPFGMMRAHDMRDWHQRQATCPPHPAHDAGFWRDAGWQLLCRYRLHNPPAFLIEPERRNDRVYIWMDRLWMAQQIPLAVLLYALGGWAFVAWGVSLRIAVSLIGHWAVGHFAHRRGHQGWRIAGLPVQGYNLPGLGLITFGENWHGNHHAFPHSARLGVEPGQFDPGYLFVRGLGALGLAWDIREPGSVPPRDGLTRIAS